MSPFKSKSQKVKLGLLVKEGKFSAEKFKEWDKSTGNAKLPERTTPKKHKDMSWLKAKIAKVLK